MKVQLYIVFWTLGFLFEAAAGVTWWLKEKVDRNSIDTTVTGPVPYRPSGARDRIKELVNTHNVLSGIGILFLFLAMFFTPNF